MQISIHTREINLILYADDITLLVTKTDRLTAEDIMNDYLEALVKWKKDIGMDEFTPEKSNAMVFQLSHSGQEAIFLMNGKRVK